MDNKIYKIILKLINEYGYTPLDKISYEKSNKKLSVKFDNYARLKKRICNMIKKGDWNEDDVIYIVREIQKKLKMRQIPVYVLDKPRYKNDYKEVYAYIVVRGGVPNKIYVYKYTAVKKKKVSVKTLINSLIHELMHQYDFEVLKLMNSYHTKGFFARIKNIYNKLTKCD